MKLIQKTNFLIFLSMLLVLSSCQTGTSSETTDDGIIEQTESTPETMVETTPFAALDTRDFGGKTFCIIDGNDYPDMHINLSSGELTGNVLNDAIFTRDGLVTEKLNVVLQAQTETCANAVRQFRNNVTAGDHSYQLIIAPVLGDGLINLVTDGAVYDLNNISRGNDAYWGKPWWSDLMYENMQLNGKFYYTTGDIAASVYQAPFCLYYNIDFGTDYGYDAEQLFADIEAGKWTYDMLYSMCGGMAQDLNGDNSYFFDDDFTGIIADKGGECVAMMVSSGIRLSEIDQEGNITVNLNHERTVKAIETLHKFYEPIFGYRDFNNVVVKKAFPGRQSLFLLHNVESAVAALRDMEDDFAILPLPKLETTQDSYISLVSGWVDAYIALPLNLEDPDFSGSVTEALARASYETVRPAAFDATSRGKLSVMKRTLSCWI